jgi:serine/threonine protein kinase
MFPSESQCMQELDHEGILKAVDVFKGVIIMPIIKGDDFTKIYQATKGSLLPKKELIDMWITMAKILQYFHSMGWMHRDLNTENWMIVDGKCMLIDYGTAIKLGEGGYTKGGIFAPTGASPEMVLKKNYSYEGDIFYMGMSMFLMQNKERLCPFGNTFRRIIDLVIVEEKFNKKMAHRAPEPEYGADFIELFNMVFDYDRSRRPNCTQLINKLEEML